MANRIFVPHSHHQSRYGQNAPVMDLHDLLASSCADPTSRIWIPEPIAAEAAKERHTLAERLQAASRPAPEEDPLPLASA